MVGELRSVSKGDLTPTPAGTPRYAPEVSLTSALGGAAVAFAVTNLDDLVLLSVFVAAGRARGHHRLAPVLGGQLAGLATLVGLSLVLGGVLRALPDGWFRVLGAVPLVLGLLGLVHAARGDGDHVLASAGGGPTLGVVYAATVANGADNVAVYAPLLRNADAAELAVVLATFAVLALVWCGLAVALGSHRRVVALVGTTGHWAVPVVLVVLGVVILAGWS